MLHVATLAEFHARWGHVQDPHVRTLVWLVTSPGVLDPAAARWQGKVASIPLSGGNTFFDWVARLDAKPEPLHLALALHKQRRLGHYAENLLAFYLQAHGLLHRQGLQVHAPHQGTLGEFDFLLHAPGHPGCLLHWELATKFYLYDAHWGQAPGVPPDLYNYLGPDPTGSLGEKTGKIFDKQLQLSTQPLAKALLTQPVVAAQALFKAWLFYREGQPVTALPGVAPPHCNGLWCQVHELPRLSQARDAQAVVVPRLQWLAPLQIKPAQAQSVAGVQAELRAMFCRNPNPQLVALLHPADPLGPAAGLLQESCRTMVVPDAWVWSACKEREKTLGLV